MLKRTRLGANSHVIKSTILIGENTYSSRKAIIVLLKLLTALF